MHCETHGTHSRKWTWVESSGFMKSLGCYLKDYVHPLNKCFSLKDKLDFHLCVSTELIVLFFSFSLFLGSVCLLRPLFPWDLILTMQVSHSPFLYTSGQDWALDCQSSRTFHSGPMNCQWYADHIQLLYFTSPWRIWTVYKVQSGFATEIPGQFRLRHLSVSLHCGWYLWQIQIRFFGGIMELVFCLQRLFGMFLKSIVKHIRNFTLSTWRLFAHNELSVYEAISSKSLKKNKKKFN